MTPAEREQHIVSTLHRELTPTFLEVVNESHLHIGHAGSQGGASHFAVIIASPKFAEKSLLECHRMILSLFAELIPDEIHALRIQCRPSQSTP